MTGEFSPSTDIPSNLLDGLDDIAISSDEMLATMKAFSWAGDGMPINLILGAKGVELATRLRIHDFGDAQTKTGLKIEEEKKNPMWLGAETLAIMDRRAREQEA
jgi:hypothetical protein